MERVPILFSLWLRLAVCLGLGAVVVACQDSHEESLPSSPAQTLEPKKVVKPPPSFDGPIDPAWPPSRPKELAVEMEASRLLDEFLNKNPHEKALSLPPQKAKQLYVKRGKLGEFEYLEIVVGPMERPNDPLPLVVWFHGRGGRATLPPKRFRARFPVRVLIPQAPDPVGNGFTWFATWTMAGKEQLLARSISARADQVASLIEAFVRLRPTVGKPLLVGFSQGGMLSLALGTRYPSRFAAAFPIAGWLPQALIPRPVKGRKYPYFYMQHGTTDKIVPFKYGKQTATALQALGVWVDFQPIPDVTHVVTDAMANNLLRGLKRALEPYAGIRAKSAKKRRRNSASAP